MAVSLLSLALAGGSYWDQHTADNAAEAAAKSAAASLVSFSPGLASREHGYVSIQNLGQRPISSATLLVAVVFDVPDGPHAWKQVTVFVREFLGDLGPCSSTRIDTLPLEILTYIAGNPKGYGSQVSGLARTELAPGQSSISYTSAMFFRDSAGQDWTFEGPEGLYQGYVQVNPAPAALIQNLPETTTTAQGCA
jgi:hypothetical protein